MLTINDDDLLSQFICDHDHTCHCASSMVDGTRKKKRLQKFIRQCEALRNYVEVSVKIHFFIC